MADVSEGELQDPVHKHAGGVCEAAQGMVREHGVQPQGAGVEDGFNRQSGEGLRGKVGKGEHGVQAQGAGVEDGFNRQSGEGLRRGGVVWLE